VGHGRAPSRHESLRVMARLIFCFFAEDTDIFQGTGLFTDTIAQMSAKDSSNTDEVIGELFRAMNTKNEDRESAGIPRWADTLVKSRFAIRCWVISRFLRLHGGTESESLRSRLPNAQGRPELQSFRD